MMPIRRGTLKFKEKIERRCHTGSHPFKRQLLNSQLKDVDPASSLVVLEVALATKNGREVSEIDELGNAHPAGMIGQVKVSLKEMLRDIKADESGTVEHNGELDLMGFLKQKHLKPAGGGIGKGGGLPLAKVAPNPKSAAAKAGGKGGGAAAKGKNEKGASFKMEKGASIVKSPVKRQSSRDLAERSTRERDEEEDEGEEEEEDPGEQINEMVMGVMQVRIAVRPNEKSEGSVPAPGANGGGSPGGGQPPASPRKLDIGGMGSLMTAAKRAPAGLSDDDGDDDGDAPPPPSYDAAYAACDSGAGVVPAAPRAAASLGGEPLRQAPHLPQDRTSMRHADSRSLGKSMRIASAVLIQCAVRGFLDRRRVHQLQVQRLAGNSRQTIGMRRKMSGSPPPRYASGSARPSPPKSPPPSPPDEGGESGAEPAVAPPPKRPSSQAPSRAASRSISRRGSGPPSVAGSDGGKSTDSDALGAAQGGSKTADPATSGQPTRAPTPSAAVAGVFQAIEEDEVEEDQRTEAQKMEDKKLANSSVSLLTSALVVPNKRDSLVYTFAYWIKWKPVETLSDQMLFFGESRNMPALVRGNKLGALIDNEFCATAFDPRLAGDNWSLLVVTNDGTFSRFYSTRGRGGRTPAPPPARALVQHSGQCRSVPLAQLPGHSALGQRRRDTEGECKRQVRGCGLALRACVGCGLAGLCACVGCGLAGLCACV